MNGVKLVLGDTEDVWVGFAFEIDVDVLQILDDLALAVDYLDMTAIGNPHSLVAGFAQDLLQEKSGRIFIDGPIENDEDHLGDDSALKEGRITDIPVPH